MQRDTIEIMSMRSVTIEEIIKQQEQQRLDVLNNSDRGQSAYALATMALEHMGGGAEAAAQLLLAMEYGKSFDFTLLLKFDSTNRAHADLVMQGYKAHELWPSKWMDAAGYHGIDIMDTLRDKWA